MLIKRLFRYSFIICSFFIIFLRKLYQNQKNFQIEIKTFVLTFFNFYDNILLESKKFILALNFRK